MEPSYFFEDMPLIAAKPVEKPVSLTEGVSCPKARAPSCS